MIRTLIRAIAAPLLLGTGVTLLALFLLVPPTLDATETLEAQVQSVTGIVRTIDTDLRALSQRRAIEASSEPGHRYLRELSDSGQWASWGEVIAYGYSDPASAVAAWMSSTQGHREVLLNRDYDSIGCGAYFGGGRWVMVCILAEREPQPAPLPQPSSPQPISPPKEIPNTAMPSSSN